MATQCQENPLLQKLGVGIAIGIGIETGRLSSKSIPIPMAPVRWHSYTVSQSERNS